MKLDHLVITRFCVRLPGVKHTAGSGPIGAFDEDPLLPATLDVRTRLLQITARACINAQSDPDVGWVLIIDPDLPQTHLKTVQGMLRSMRRVHVHVFDQSKDDLHSSDWLQPYVRPGTTHLLTTNLDDDDVLPADFARFCRQHILTCQAQYRLPSIKVLASTQVLQWDMIPTLRAPLGSLKYRRHQRTPTLSATGPPFTTCLGRGPRPTSFMTLALISGRS